MNLTTYIFKGKQMLSVVFGEEDEDTLQQLISSTGTSKFSGMPTYCLVDKVLQFGRRKPKWACAEDPIVVLVRHPLTILLAKGEKLAFAQIYLSSLYACLDEYGDNVARCLGH